MRVRHLTNVQFKPLWVVAVLSLALPFALAVVWFRLPKARETGPCLARDFVPDEETATAFSIALRRAILDNPGGPFELHATDVALTSYVALNTQGYQLADPQVRITPDGVCLSGRIVGLGLLTPRFRILADVRVVDGMLEFRFRKFVLNGHLLPPALRKLLQRVTNESLRDAHWPLRIEGVELRDGEIVLTGLRLSAP